MPSGGDLSNPKDKESVQGLEDKMIEAYGKSLVESKCKAGGEVDLSSKMVRAVHVDALGEALAKFQVVVLNLDTNQLGAEGAKKLAGYLRSNQTLKTLR